MNKFKNITIIIIIIGLYITCITNIKYFIKDMDERLIKYDNKYASKVNDEIIYEIFNIGKSKIDDKELKEIKNNNFIINMLGKITNNTKEELFSYLDKQYQSGLLEKTYMEHYQDLYYLYMGSFVLIYSKDLNNIYFQNYGLSEICNNCEYEDTEIDNISNIIIEKLDDAGIIKKYNFQIEMIKKGNATELIGPDLYYATDYTHNIKIEYSNYFKMFYNIQIGFNK